MATASRRNRSEKTNVWDLLLALVRSPKGVRWARNTTVLVIMGLLLVIALVVVLPGKHLKIADIDIGARPTTPEPVAASTIAPSGTPLTAALASTETPPQSPNTPTLAVATTTPEVLASPTPTAAPPGCRPPASPLPRNAQLITCAWGFWDDARYMEAIAVADECIDAFEGQALRDQHALSLDGQPAPITGQPRSKAEMNEILKRGVLNDVAACHFVKGQALERLGQLDDAKEEYGNVLHYPHARVWDPGGDSTGLGYFWSPAQAASDRLATIP